MTDQHERLLCVAGNETGSAPTVEIDEPERAAGIDELEHASWPVQPIDVASGGLLPVGEHVIVNPISGERIVIRESGVQTGGRVLSFDLFLPPGAHVPARHVHPIQEERFTVVEGQMRFRLGRFGRRTIMAQPGDTVSIPPGTAHWFGNAGAGVTHARVEARPALRMEEMLEAAAAMRPARYVPGARMPRLSELAIFLGAFQRELAVPDVPARLVHAILAPFAWLGRRGRATTPGRGRAATRGAAR